MKFKKLYVVLPVFALLLSSCVENDSSAIVGSPDFHHDFASAMAESKSTGKPIVTIFSASWCPPCQTMKKKVYPSEAVAPYHKSFVWAYLDADQEANRPLMTEHGVEGIPQISFVSPSGEILDKVVGGRSSDDFAGILKGILAK